MSVKKRICIVTGTRAEWGLFYPLAKEIASRPDLFELAIIATGAHVSEAHGKTVSEIEKDGFSISRRVEILCPGDSAGSTIQAVSACISGMAEALIQVSPDAVCLLGDRYETFASAIAAFMLKVPIAHIHGGEVTEGSMDDAFRHSITKMASVHFVSAPDHARRVVQMGEDPSRVFNVGGLGLDNIKSVRKIAREEIERKIGMALGEKNILVTYHPVTLEGRGSSDAGFRALLDVLARMEDVKVVFTRPNADMYSGDINDAIDYFVSKHSERAVCVMSLGRELYLNTVPLMSAVAGNSSSGIIEVPGLGVPTVNIGDRQKGRIRAASVIDARPEAGSIKGAFQKAFDAEFRRSCKEADNPYGNGDTAVRITDILAEPVKLTIKKKFYDIDPKPNPGW